MSIIILAKGSDGGRRRCDANCYNAKKETCICVCEGKNHGLGLWVALRKTDDKVVEMLERQNPAWKIERPWHQRELLPRSKAEKEVNQ